MTAYVRKAYRSVNYISWSDAP